MSEPKAQQEPSMEEILASIRRIISEDGSGETKTAEPEAAAAPAAKPEAVEKSDVLELTEVVEESPEPAEEESAEEEEIELREEPEDDSPMPFVPPPPSVAPPPPAAPAADGGLISPPTAASATSMLSSLVEAVDASRGGTPIGQGNRTIEDLVKEVMRPMIKDWLDSNLPGLVERLVRREIERLSRNAEGED